MKTVTLVLSILLNLCLAALYAKDYIYDVAVARTQKAMTDGIYATLQKQKYIVLTYGGQKITLVPSKPIVDPNNKEQQ